MTVATTPRLAGPFTGTGADATLAFSFKCFDATEILVTRNGTPLALTTDYTINLNADQEASPGGAVLIHAAANTLSAAVLVKGNTVAKQPTSLPSQSTWSPKTVEQALDRLAMLLQEQRLMLDGNESSLRVDLLSVIGAALIKAASGQTAQYYFDLLGGSSSYGVLSGSQTPLVVTRAASSGNVNLDLRSQVDIFNFTGATGAAQINQRNFQQRVLHSAGTITAVVQEQGYVALGVESTATTTGNVSSLQVKQWHISHTGSGHVVDAFTVNLPGPDLNIGTGTIDNFVNCRGGDIGASRITTFASNFHGPNSSLSTTPILANFTGEMSWDNTGRRWNICFIGGANNYIAGRVRIGGALVGGVPVAPTEFLEVVGGIRACTQGTTIASIGFATGAGGAATQATNKGTGVTLDKPCGQITMNNAALAAGAVVTFTLTSASIAADDDVRVWVKSGNAADGSYRVTTEGNAAGSRKVIVENKTGGSLSEALVLGFRVHKVVVA